jgi:hypothetical protein
MRRDPECLALLSLNNTLFRFRVLHTFFPRSSSRPIQLSSAMVAFRSTTSEDPFPRSPFQIADEFRQTLQARSPRRFAHTHVRVANGAVALTGSVPNWQSRSLAVRLAREAFAGLQVIDALEVQNRRTFGSAA